MKRVIVDYAKLTNEILTLLVEKFPDGYDDSDIVRFKNIKNENIEAVEVRTEDTIFLVKVSTKLADRIENFEDEDEDDDSTEGSLDSIDDLEIVDESTEEATEED
jgi:DNA-directed RNA polymerase subunit delta